MRLARKMTSKIGSYARYVVNAVSRKVLNERLRKTLVEHYYSTKSSLINRSAEYAPHTAADLLDWRRTLGYRYRCSRGVYRGNCFYGAGYWMQQYAGFGSTAKAAIEHGVYFGNYVNDAELDGSGLPCLITFGPSRVSHISAVSNVPIAAVGPYIAYAPDYLSSEDQISLKSSLGKILLVFPSHSVDRVSVAFDFEGLFEEIDQVVELNQIDEVLVCLYYRDLLNGAAARYEAKGYRVVTAGYREDLLFLPRLRSLIKVSDLTMSNSVGTHVGYCAFMGKPHRVLHQSKSFQAASSKDKTEFENDYVEQSTKEKRDVEIAFQDFHSSQMKQEVCASYWGFGKTLDSFTMHALLLACDQAFSAKPTECQNAFRSIVECSGELSGVVKL